MGEYKLVVWDVDGTLLNTSEGIIASAKYTIDRFGLEIPGKDVMKTYIGPPIQDSFARTLPIDVQMARSMADVFRERYKSEDLLKAFPYDGVIGLLRDLQAKGIKQAVATYKRQDYAERIVEHFGLSCYMDAVCGSDFEGTLNKADIIGNAIAAVGIHDKKRIVMIGDTGNDSLGAAKMGVDFIGVSYGFGVWDDADDAVRLAADVKEIRSILLGKE